MITFAQNFEDVMLARLFEGRAQGFYVDVGAGHPTRMSVTKHFYDLGWRGINVEPITNNWELFCKERPRDTNLNVAISSHPGRRPFCEVLDDDALSTIDGQRMEEIVAGGAVTLRYDVECVTGDSILEQVGAEIDFIKIDVEGAEEDVLRSIDLRRHQPKVLVVEAVAAGSGFAGWSGYSPAIHAKWHGWESRVVESGYVFGHSDGLNRFYLRADLAYLAPRLALPPGVFDFIVPDLYEHFTRKHPSDATLLSSLQEKETLIHSLHGAAAAGQSREIEMTRSLEQKEAMIVSLGSSLRQAESYQRLIATAMEERESVFQTLQEVLGQLKAGPRESAFGSHDLEGAMRSLRHAGESPESHIALVKALEEKERVIQELRRAVDAYRAAFSIFGFIVRPINFALSPLRFAIQRLRRVLVPRLGNLEQHAPRELRLPAHYYQSASLTTYPRISIVTPSYNQAAFVERTMRSVLEQSYPNLQYYVQDGGSTDGTGEILRRYAEQLSGFDSRPDSGQTQAINRGFVRTDGEIMAWLNSDDVLFPGALSYIADYFNRHPDVDVVYGHRILIDANDHQIGRWILPVHDDPVLSWADFVPQETLFWRRRIWDKAGGRVDESFQFAMDWDLLVRFRDAGARFALLPRLIGGFRIHPHQKTTAVITEVGFKEMDRIRERSLGRIPSRAEISKAIFPYLIRHVVADFRWRMGNLFGASQ